MNKQHARYKLNVARDVDRNEDGYFLYLPFGSEALTERASKEQP